MNDDLTLKILVGTLPPALVGAALVWFVVGRRASHQEAVIDVVAAYRMRRRRSSPWALASAAGFVAVILCGYLALNPQEGILGSMTLAIGLGSSGLVAFAVGQAGLWATYRCPACERPLVDDGVWLLDPSACPSCGRRLR